MAKKLVSRYIVEIYEVTPELQADKQELKEELAKVITDNIDKEIIVAGRKITADKLKQLALKREKEIADYYSGEVKIDTQANKQ